ncbi:MAG: 30S ribosomal protein S12 methylthiotransferase RimO [Chitinispirillaceae bacterium]|jgi:ribosomal protein S12 methylthiotransferase
MPTVALQNLGCSKNMIDGERIAHLFCAAGYKVVLEFAKADVIVVNTCAFIREAQEEAVEAILEFAALKKDGRCRRLIVSGCFSERYRDKVTKLFPEVDLWVGVHDWEQLLARQLNPASLSPFKRELAEPIATQYLKIAEGCSHSCTYCVIPRLRGKYRSRPVRDIINEAKWLEEKGVRELIIVAQDTSFYGKDIGTSLVKLLEKLLKTTSFPWLRLMYLHPAHVDDALLRLFASEKRLCSYFDMPLQHIADPVLKAMNRSPLSKGLRSLIAKIRKVVPDAGLRSTFILGFPGETDSHFKDLLRFVEEIKFDRLGVFPWSPEEGTRAAGMPHRPRSSTVDVRCETLMLIQRDISRKALSRRVGSIMEAIVEGPSENRSYSFRGRTRFDAPEIDGNVFIKNHRCIPGTITKVKITGSGDYDLIGEPIL